jgi:bifunctional DNA-binding transcriptional regulator/antitoxin component of YhaV-PrlF toxin-antitoxin module
MKVRGPLILSGKTSTGVRIPNEVVEALGQSRKPAVKATVNGHTWRSSIAFMGGEFWLGISAENREAAGVKAGDMIEVDLELDTEPRVLQIPADLTEALEREPEAKAYFETLSYSNKRRHVLAIEGAKAAETRQRRIDKSVGMFKEGRN